MLFFLPLESRRVPIAGITAQPDQNGMQQIARNATLDPWGYLHHCRYVLHDRDTKFCALFQNTLSTGNGKCLTLPRRSPDWNALAERWVRSIKQECLDQLLLVGESSLRRALSQFTEHYHRERNHKGREMFYCSPAPTRSVRHVEHRFHVESASVAFSSITTQGTYEFLTIRDLQREAILG